VPARIMKNEQAHLYAPSDPTPTGQNVIDALQELGQAAAFAEDHARAALRMSALDTMATRYLLEAQRENRDVSPTNLATMLNVSTAAVTKLIDRLVDAGRAERVPHPTDRRGFIIRPTPGTEEAIHTSYSTIHAPLVSIVNALPPEEADAITRFARTLASALTGTAPHAPDEN